MALGKVDNSSSGVAGQALIYASYDGGTNFVPVRVDSTGNLVAGNELSSYIASDIDIVADSKYYGFLRSDGYWYIMKEITSAGSYRFIKGTTGYTTNWTGRAGLSYGYFDAIF